VRRVWAWLIIACVAGSCKGVNHEAFEGVNQAGREIELAIGAKADLPRYEQVLADFTTQLASARSQAQSEADRALVAAYEDVQRQLDDMRLVWEAREARQAELLPIADPVAGRVQQQYDLPVNTNDPPSIYAGEALQRIWEDTKNKIDALASR
jgi:hypothetical protein